MNRRQKKMKPQKRILDDVLWGNESLVEHTDSTCDGFLTAVTHSCGLWTMLVEWQSFPCFGSVRHSHRIPDFRVTNKTQEPSECVQWESRFLFMAPNDPPQRRPVSHTDQKDKTRWKKDWESENASLGQSVYVLIGSWNSRVIRYLWPERIMWFLSWKASASFTPTSKEWLGYDATFLAFSCCFLGRTIKSFAFWPFFGSGEMMPLGNK